ncbi:MAG: hypothetical protein R3F50_00060 [Gammaproteobacteria bacterium]|jgi:hypothetical protein
MFKRFFVQSLVLVSFLLSAQFASADVSGNWVFAVNVMGQTGNAQVTMAQNESQLSGHYTGQLGDTDFTGSANGDDFEFVLVGDAGSVTYRGTLQPDGTITGTVDLAGMAEGSFTARKSG